MGTTSWLTYANYQAMSLAVSKAWHAGIACVGVNAAATLEGRALWRRYSARHGRLYLPGEIDWDRYERAVGGGPRWLGDAFERLEGWRLILAGPLTGAYYEIARPPMSALAWRTLRVLCRSAAGGRCPIAPTA